MGTASGPWVTVSKAAGPQFFLKLICTGMQLLYTAVLVSAVRQSEPAIHTLFTGCPSHLGHHGALGSVPWATEWPLVSQLSYTEHHWSVCVHLNLPVHSTLRPPHCVPPWCLYIILCVSGSGSAVTETKFCQQTE